MAPRSFMGTFLSAASLLLLATASPVLSEDSNDYAASNGQRLQRRADNFTAVTGIIGQGVYPRLEIRELEQNADQWNIYLLGLVRFHQMNQTEKLSYYQIAGKRAQSQCEQRMVLLIRFAPRHSRPTIYPLGRRVGRAGHYQPRLLPPRIQPVCVVASTIPGAV